MSGMRAPMTAAPAVGCGAAGPKSGAQPASAIFVGQPLELAAPDVFEIPARGVRGRFLVQIHRDLEARRHFGAHFPCERDAVGHRRALDRHERHDVDGAEPRVLAAMPAKIDVGDGRSNSARTARSTPSASPASVKTDRLCDGSEEWSSRRTPGIARTAAAIAAMTSGRRPSLTFGMHSITMRAFDSSSVLPWIAML